MIRLFHKSYKRWEQNYVKQKGEDSLTRVRKKSRAKMTDSFRVSDENLATISKTRSETFRKYASFRFRTL